MPFTAAHRENSQIPEWPRVSVVPGMKNLQKKKIFAVTPAEHHLH